jgi:hypothetical protein
LLQELKSNFCYSGETIFGRLGSIYVADIKEAKYEKVNISNAITQQKHLRDSGQKQHNQQPYVAIINYLMANSKNIPGRKFKTTLTQFIVNLFLFQRLYVKFSRNSIARGHAERM